MARVRVEILDEDGFTLVIRSGDTILLRRGGYGSKTHAREAARAWKQCRARRLS